MIKKTIQRNHVFAIYTLLLKNAIFVNDPFRVFAYPEYRFEGCLL